MWTPPVHLKSSCYIDLHYYPFDVQSCVLRLGAWTKSGINLQLKTNRNQTIHHNRWFLKDGIDLSAFRSNTEYDILGTPAQLVRKKSNHNSKAYEEIVFNIRLSRRPLYFVVHLILPCTIINALSIFVFYLPSASKEKVKKNFSF